MQNIYKMKEHTLAVFDLIFFPLLVAIIFSFIYLGINLNNDPQYGIYSSFNTKGYILAVINVVLIVFLVVLRMSMIKERSKSFLSIKVMIIVASSTLVGYNILNLILFGYVWTNHNDIFLKSKIIIEVLIIAISAVFLIVFSISPKRNWTFYEEVKPIHITNFNDSYIKFNLLMIIPGSLILISEMITLEKLYYFRNLLILSFIFDILLAVGIIFLIFYFNAVSEEKALFNKILIIVVVSILFGISVGNVAVYGVLTYRSLISSSVFHMDALVNTILINFASIAHLCGSIFFGIIAIIYLVKISKKTTMFWPLPEENLPVLIAKIKKEKEIASYIDAKVKNSEKVRLYDLSNTLMLPYSYLARRLKKWISKGTISGQLNEFDRANGEIIIVKRKENYNDIQQVFSPPTPTIKEKLKKNISFSQNQTSNLNSSQDFSFNKYQNQDFSFNKYQNQDFSFNKYQNQNKSSNLDSSQDRTFNRSQDRMLIKSQDQIFNKSQDQTFNKSQDQKFNRSQDQTFNKSQDQTFKKSQDQTFNKSQDQTFNKNNRSGSEQTRNLPISLNGYMKSEFAKFGSSIFIVGIASLIFGVGILIPFAGGEIILAGIVLKFIFSLLALISIKKIAIGMRNFQLRRFYNKQIISLIISSLGGILLGIGLILIYTGISNVIKLWVASYTTHPTLMGIIFYFLMYGVPNIIKAGFIITVISLVAIMVGALLEITPMSYLKSFFKDKSNLLVDMNEYESKENFNNLKIGNICLYLSLLIFTMPIGGIFDIIGYLRIGGALKKLNDAWSPSSSSFTQQQWMQRPQHQRKEIEQNSEHELIKMQQNKFPPQTNQTPKIESAKLHLSDSEIHSETPISYIDNPKMLKRLFGYMKLFNEFYISDACASLKIPEDELKSIIFELVADGKIEGSLNKENLFQLKSISDHALG